MVFVEGGWFGGAISVGDYDWFMGLGRRDRPKNKAEAPNLRPREEIHTRNM